MNTTKRLVIGVITMSAVVLFAGWKLLGFVMSENNDERKLATCLILIAVIALVYITVLVISFGIVMPVGVRGRARVVKRFMRRMDCNISSEACERIAEASLMTDSPWAEQIIIMHEGGNKNLMSIIKPQGEEINIYLLYLLIFKDPKIKLTKSEQDETIYGSFDILYDDLKKNIDNEPEKTLEASEIIQKADKSVNIHFRYENIFSLWQDLMMNRGKKKLLHEKNKVLKSEIDECCEKYEGS